MVAEGIRRLCCAPGLLVECEVGECGCSWVEGHARGGSAEPIAAKSGGYRSRAGAGRWFLGLAGSACGKADAACVWGVHGGRRAALLWLFIPLLLLLLLLLLGLC